MRLHKPKVTDVMDVVSIVIYMLTGLVASGKFVYFSITESPWWITLATFFFSCFLFLFYFTFIWEKKEGGDSKCSKS